ncbi:septum formation protein Maf [Collimonas arenae]|uniref:dTTP/UTP pyrophosphatase n=1 Tax=Collimonas arenae TaxID=279058 RepID=A0A127QFH6_9BURK|nr:nucleoside triphosphate pyrophosphatase [Collimonas arenae]AMO98918.1 septum formation protein Maf [Collimonas arenae]AMP08809.1 septum formation protein Maf [Collimonas arenae]
MKNPFQKIYLASKSPRRRELLRQIDVAFELLLLRDQTPRGPDVSEEVLPDEAPQAYVTRVTMEKARSAHQMMIWRSLPARPILAADTTVTIDGKILGKPANKQEAVEMLRLLSGRTHQVLTSVAVIHHEQSWQLTQVSDVLFKELSDAMINAYCETSEPYDKAGGYGIQGLAAIFIESIRGSHSGIMGLPLFETAQLLQQAGIRIL